MPQSWQKVKKSSKAELEKTRKIWYLFLRKFWPLLLKTNFWSGDSKCPASWPSLEIFLSFLNFLRSWGWSLSITLEAIHIQSLLYWISRLAYVEPEVHSQPCETLSRHIRNPAIVRTVSWDIIQPHSGPCVAFAYLKTWHNPGIFKNPSIIRSSRIFRTLSYLRK